MALFTLKLITEMDCLPHMEVKIKILLTQEFELFLWYLTVPIQLDVSTK